MKHFYVITNREKDKELQITRQIHDYLTSRGVDCRYGEQIPDETDCIIVLGGDGTLLQAARENIEKNIPLIGVNLGRLGYLAEVETKNLEAALNALIEGQYEIEERMMIVGAVYQQEKIIQEMYALNDIVVARDGLSQIIYYHIYVNGQLLNSYHADGVILSTPTGSTGYSMSAGGPIVEPKANLIVVTPICPHTIYARSIVLSPEDRIRIEIGEGKYAKNQNANVNFDGEYTTPLTNGMIVDIARSSKVARIIKVNQVSFLTTLQQKMSDA